MNKLSINGDKEGFGPGRPVPSMTCKRTIDPTDPTPPPRFLSFLVSICSTPIGVAYALRILQPTWDAAELLERDALSQAVLTVFLTYLIVDMGLGLLEYRSEFGVLSGCT